MAVNKKEKKLMQDMWDGAEEQPEGSLPDGKYHFEITEAEFGMSQSDKPRMASVIKVVGGDEDYLDEELSLYDNLETPENMSWFKRKLTRLKLDIPEDFEEIADGTVAESMVGCIFEGQVKTKDGFLNVYVNKLIGEAEEAGEESGEEAGEEPGEEETVEVDDEVTFEDEAGDKISGTVKEIDTKKEEADVEDENEEVWTVPLSELSIVYEEEAGEESGSDFATPDDVGAMKKKALGEFLESVGLDADELTSPKDIAMVIAEVKAGEDPKRPWLVKALKAYGCKPKQADKDSALIKSILAEIDAAIME